MEDEPKLPCSSQPATGPNSEPDESSPQPHILFLQFSSQYNPFTSRSGKFSLTSGWNFNSPPDNNYVTLCQGLTCKNCVFTGEGLCIVRFVKTGPLTSVWRVSYKLNKGPTSSQVAIEKLWLAANFPLDIRLLLRSFGSLSGSLKAQPRTLRST
jgi:hypothetical protein